MITKRQGTMQRRFRRIVEFLTTNVIAGTAVKLKQLKDVIDGIESGGAEHDTSSRVTRGETKRQRALRDVLWNHYMVPIARIARRIFGVPGLDVKFKLPPKRSDNEALLSSARGMAQAADSHADVFGQEGLPSDFLQQFHSAIDDLAGALTVRVESQRQRKTSGQTLNQLVKRGIAVVDVLDAIVTPRLESQPDVLAAWNSVKRPLEVGGGAPAAADATVTPASVAATPPAAAVVKAA